MRDFVLSDDPVVPMLHPRILAELAVEAGASLQEVLGGTGIPAAALGSPEARITLVQYGRLVDNTMRLTGDAALGLRLGRSIQLHNLGMLGLLVMSSETAGQALEAGVQYQAALSPVLDLELHRSGSWARLRCRPTMPMGHYEGFAIEALVSVVLENAGKLLPGGVVVEEVCLPYPKPEHFEAYDHDRVRSYVFDQEYAEVRFDAALLDVRLGGGDPITAELARRQCAAQLGPVSRGLLGQIRDHLDASPGVYPSMEKVARDLRTSPRSLRRYLRGMSTSYQALVDESRRRHAEQAVRNTTLTIQQVAQLVGYEDVRGFRRAWVRWTGKTPSEYRQSLHSHLHAVAS